MKPNKDPRWNKVKGMTFSINIIHGRMKKGFLERHLATKIHYERDQLIKQINKGKTHG